MVPLEKWGKKVSGKILGKSMSCLVSSDFKEAMQ
jgi:hypothetical protein